MSAFQLACAPRQASHAALQVSETAMEALIEQCRSDIRLVLNTLQVRPMQPTCAILAFP